MLRAREGEAPAEPHKRNGSPGGSPSQFLNRENAKEKRKTRKKNNNRRKESRYEKDFSVESKSIRDIRDSKISWNSILFVFSRFENAARIKSQVCG